ncbi:uncharacterized protein LOC126838956 isoform X2 [Adelges cooleyi]|uniref:uncharacterized protein LOC126838956 isoform X2 n=1 Tax=Adelges cooleyi TaxID=133065 RepID=UPI00217F5ECE|nr:uncharacterized protein LOC126838956 isoform X2 [Adelges cooleyi]
MDNHRTPLNLSAIALLTALAVTCSLGAPASLSTDSGSETQSKDSNEVGPLQENWQLFERLAKNKSYGGPSVDPEKTRQLIKEIEEFSRLVQTTTTVTPVPADNGTAVEDDDDDSFASASDWFDKLWKEITDGMDFDGLDDDDKGKPDNDAPPPDVPPTTEADAETIGYVRPQSQGQETEDGGTVEEIIRKLNNDLKRVSNNRADDLTELSGSGSEQEVFVITNPLIGDNDKSNKYTLPINAE